MIFSGSKLLHCGTLDGMFKKTNQWDDSDYREIINLPTHLVAVIAPDGTFHKVNEESNEILGWLPEEACGKKVSDFIHTEDVDNTLGTLSGLLLGTKNIVTHHINRCKRKDGTYRWINWSAKARGGYIYALGTDITEKVQFEQELTIQGLVLESISEGVVITNEAGMIVYINSAEEMLFGYEADELLGNSIYLLNAQNKEESKIYLREVFEALNKDGIWIGEWLNVKKDGTKFITSCRVTTLMLNNERHLVIVQRDISRRKQRQAENEALQSRFKTFFEQSILPMMIFDINGYPLSVNQAFKDMFGSDSPSDMNLFTHAGTKIFGTLPYIKRAYEGEAVEVPAFYFDPALLGTTGKSRWIEAWFSPVKDENNKIKELAVILKDVTEQMEAQKLLEQTNNAKKVAEDRLSMAVKIGQVGIWEWRQEEEKLYWDETLMHIYGLTKETFTGKLDQYLKAIHPDDFESTWNTVLQSQRDHKPYIVEHRIIRPDGSIRWIQGSGTAFFESGKLILMMGTAIDITEKKVAALDQQFISEISEVLSSSFNITENLEKMSELAIGYFCDGCIIDQLRADGDIERIVVTTRKPIIREKLISIQHNFPLRHTDEHPLFSALITGKTVFMKDAREVWPQMREKFGDAYYNELRQMNVRGSIVCRLKGRESLLGTITFLTDAGSMFTFEDRHKHLAEEIAYRTSMALENSLLYLHSQDAIKTRDEFLSIASHELKTPLTSLTLQNQMRKRQLDKGDHSALDEIKVRKMIESDDRQLRRINRLIDDMLDIARIRASRLTIHKEDFEFCTFARDVVERFAPQMEASGCDLTLNMCDSLMINGDIYRIEQVIVNMLTNAMKYGAGKPIQIEVVKTSYKVSFMVTDNGPGIEAKDIERIFQRFERAVTGREISGLGLGLYISRQIVEQHDGSLFVLSQPGKGSTFVMDLPL